MILIGDSWEDVRDLQDCIELVSLYFNRDLAEMMKELFDKEISDVRAELEDAESEIELLNHELYQLEMENDRLETKVDELEDQVDEMRSSRW